MSNRERSKLSLCVLGAGAILLGAAVLQSVLIAVPGPDRDGPDAVKNRNEPSAADPAARTELRGTDRTQAEPATKATTPEPETSERPQTGALPDVAPSADRPADTTNLATPAPNEADAVATDRTEPPSPPIDSTHGIEPEPTSAAPAQPAEPETRSANQAESAETKAPATPESEPIVRSANAEAPIEVQPDAATSPQAEPPLKPEPPQAPARPDNAPMVRSADAEASSEGQPNAATSQQTEPPPVTKSASSRQTPAPSEGRHMARPKESVGRHMARPKESVAPAAQGKSRSKPMTLGAGLGSSKSLIETATRGTAGTYGANVRAAIGRHKPKAVGAGGSATVSFAIGPGGGLRSLRISRSSGKAPLDQAALASVRNAAPFPPPPAGVNPAYTIQIFFH